jgi:flagellar motility protein MotE (MotC chaperone)
MKRFIISCQIVIVAFFVIKILFLTEALQIESIPSVFLLGHFRQAIAQTTKSAPPATINVKDVTDDPLKKERDLFTALQKKQRDLDMRESSLKTEEQKSLALKKEIMEKIDTLKSLENQLSSKLDMDKTNETKRLQDLAKVYEATPPQKAAAMVEQLEIRTAARITINMKRERAGLIWGYLTPKKAVAITNEITRTARLAAE